MIIINLEIQTLCLTGSQYIAFEELCRYNHIIFDYMSCNILNLVNPIDVIIIYAII